MLVEIQKIRYIDPSREVFWTKYCIHAAAWFHCLLCELACVLVPLLKAICEKPIQNSNSENGKAFLFLLPLLARLALQPSSRPPSPTCARSSRPTSGPARTAAADHRGPRASRSACPLPRQVGNFTGTIASPPRPPRLPTPYPASAHAGNENDNGSRQGCPPLVPSSPAGRSNTTSASTC